MNSEAIEYYQDKLSAAQDTKGRIDTMLTLAGSGFCSFSESELRRLTTEGLLLEHDIAYYKAQLECAKTDTCILVCVAGIGRTCASLKLGKL